MNSHSDSESPTESGRYGGSNARNGSKTAAAEPVCEQNVRFLGSMDARRAVDAGRRAVCGQRMPGSAPDLHVHDALRTPVTIVQEASAAPGSSLVLVLGET